MVTCGGERTCFLAISVKLQKMDGEGEFVPCIMLLASMQLHSQCKLVCISLSHNKLTLTNFIAMAFLWAVHINVHNALTAIFLYGLNCGPWYSINVKMTLMKLIKLFRLI